MDNNTRIRNNLLYDLVLKEKKKRKKIAKYQQIENFFLEESFGNGWKNWQLAHRVAGSQWRRESVDPLCPVGFSILRRDKTAEAVAFSRGC